MSCKVRISSIVFLLPCSYTSTLSFTNHSLTWAQLPDMVDSSASVANDCCCCYNHIGYCAMAEDKASQAG